MEIKNQDDGKRGSFYIENEGEHIGKMEYMFAGPKKMVIINTEVDDAWKGKGLGKQLIKAGVGYARDHHKKILPICKFAKKILETTPEYSDVLF